MKERIKELAEQAGLALTPNTNWFGRAIDLERFAELVRQDERELCAKLVEEVGRQTAKAIRARSKHD